jgi:hypothetical protein
LVRSIDACSKRANSAASGEPQRLGATRTALEDHRRCDESDGGANMGRRATVEKIRRGAATHFPVLKTRTFPDLKTITRRAAHTAELGVWHGQCCAALRRHRVSQSTGGEAMVIHVRKRAAGLLFAVVMLVPSHTQALPRYGPLEVAGNVSAQNLIRMTDIDQYSLVQQRNTVKLRVDYAMFDQGKFANLFEVPFIDRGKVFLLYRGVYDSVYNTTPGIPQKDIYGRNIPQRLDGFTHSELNSLAFENQLREAYLDLTFKTVPLTLRLGRQQIVWGETDNFRLLDRVNALDLTWHLQQESWDELRQPYWMIKGLVDFDRIGGLSPLSNSFLEFYWNPGDWSPAKKDFLPRPWSAPITNPLVNSQQPPAGGRGLFNILNTQTPFKVSSLYNQTVLFQQGDYSRNPKDNSQVGVRFGAVTPQGVQFTLNYFYQRWAGGDDGTNAAAYTAILDTAKALAGLKRGEAPLEAIFPYVNTVGFSLNYAEEEHTQTVYRMESIYEFGVPFSDASKHFSNRGSFALLARDVFGVSKRDMWKGSLAFDRPTWIRALNEKSTVLVLGQFFWHYLLDNPNILCNNPAEGPPCANSGQAKGFRGQFSTSGISSTGQSGVGAVIDKVRDWEALVTLAATTFYRGGKIVPFVIYVIDPVNSYNMEVIWMFDYFITNNIIVNLSQRYFINTVSHPVYESWGVAGINRGRSETGLRLTYQF